MSDQSNPFNFGIMQGPPYIDIDAIRRSTKTIEEGTVPLTPKMKEFLNQWRIASMNNKRIFEPLKNYARRTGIDPRNPPIPIPPGSKA